MANTASPQEPRRDPEKGLYGNMTISQGSFAAISGTIIVGVVVVVAAIVGLFAAGSSAAGAIDTPDMFLALPTATLYQIPPETTASVVEIQLAEMLGVVAEVSVADTTLEVAYDGGLDPVTLLDISSVIVNGTRNSSAAVDTVVVAGADRTVQIDLASLQAWFENDIDNLNVLALFETTS